MDILVADDSADSRLVLEHVLRAEEYRVTSVDDGLAALESAKKFPPDLIISDIMMPRMDGFELCRQLKSIPSLAHIPVIFYSSSFIDEEDRRLAQALGVASFLIKPQPPQQLCNIVEQVLRSSSESSDSVEVSGTQPRLRIDEMYVQSVGRKLDEKVEELEAEREALKKSEEKFRTIFNAVNDAIFIHDAQNRAILYTNKTFSNMFGYEPDEVASLTVEKLSSGEPPYTQREAAEWMKKAAAGEPQVFDWHSRHKSGRLFWTGISMIRATIGNDERIIVVARDISARKQAEKKRLELEAKLRQKYKMEAVGVMAGGVAHDFNNKLAIILGNIEYAQMKTDPYSEVATPLNNAKTATLRARDLVKQILTYSRKGNQILKPIDIGAIMTETVGLLRSTIPATIAIDFDNADGAMTISADATQIQEVIINLCNNSVHAMNGSGHLQLTLDNVAADQITLSPHYEGDATSFARITIADDGCGMSPELMEKIFDPFFTTKGLAEGTGMGLAVVQGIIDSHNGFLLLSSAVGRGTTFELFFPTIETVLLDNAVNPAEAKPLSGGAEKILVVDDEEKLVRIMRRILEEYGYQVTTMTSSVEAMQRIQSDPAAFDLVITDQSMPELSGRDLVAKLLNIREDLPIILCTGYSSKVDEEQAKKLGVRAFCLKPLDMDQLVETTRRVLDGEILTD